MRALIALAIVCGCSRDIIPVIPDGFAQGASTAAADPTFQVVARVAGVKDPLPVSGADVAFADLATSLDQAVRRSVPPRHDNVLTVELIAGDASYKDTRLSVSLVVRATLRLRYGDTFIAQKQVVCRDGAIVEPDRGARVIWSCMTRIGQDLGGWLEDLPQ
ncbi:MAG TPA: hypothetical protein VGG28_29445 [Kofleriaceae bacterium]